jgi:hypothetical protein
MERTRRNLRLTKIVFDDLSDKRMALKRGEDIDKAEELNFEMLILHTQSQKRPRPPSRIKG